MVRRTDVEHREHEALRGLGLELGLGLGLGLGGPMSSAVSTKRRAASGTVHLGDAGSNRTVISY